MLFELSKDLGYASWLLSKGPLPNIRALAECLRIGYLELLYIRFKLGLHLWSRRGHVQVCQRLFVE